ncbi:MAG: AraC family transcriptional regulator [Balneolaceae bacterium]
MKISIKNMVCPRCVASVSEVTSQMNLPAKQVELGFVEIDRKLSEDEINLLSDKLQKKGFELIFDRETELVNLVKTTLISFVDHLIEADYPQKLSHFVSEKTNYNYSYLSKIFSEQTGMTIETYLIRLKIERVKEMLNFRKWTLSEIAWTLNYSSVQYLSNQFKKVTGQTVTEYLEGKGLPRKTLDQI